MTVMTSDNIETLVKMVEGGQEQENAFKNGVSVQQSIQNDVSNTPENMVKKWKWRGMARKRNVNENSEKNPVLVGSQGPTKRPRSARTRPPLQESVSLSCSPTTSEQASSPQPHHFDHDTSTGSFQPPPAFPVNSRLGSDVPLIEEPLQLASIPGAPTLPDQLGKYPNLAHSLLEAILLIDANQVPDCPLPPAVTPGDYGIGATSMDILQEGHPMHASVAIQGSPAESEGELSPPVPPSSNIWVTPKLNPPPTPSGTSSRRGDLGEPSIAGRRIRKRKQLLDTVIEDPSHLAQRVRLDPPDGGGSREFVVSECEPSTLTHHPCPPEFWHVGLLDNSELSKRLYMLGDGATATPEQNRCHRKKELRKLENDVKKKLKAWRSKLAELQEVNGDDRENSDKTGLVITAEHRDSIVNSMVESCHHDPEMRAVFLASVKQLMDCGVLQRSADNLQAQGPCDASSRVLNAWKETVAQPQEETRATILLYKSVEKLHQQGEVLRPKLPQLQDISACALSRTSEGAWQLTLPS